MHNNDKGGGGTARVQAETRADERAYLRIKSARLRQMGGRSIVADIRDLSRTGFRAEWPHGKNVGDRVWLTLPGLAPLLAAVVWTSGFEIGCKFETPMHAAIFERVKALPSD